MPDTETSALTEIKRNGLGAMMRLMASAREIAPEATSDARYAEAAATSAFPALLFALG